jgi:hypothetical protein
MPAPAAAEAERLIRDKIRRFLDRIREQFDGNDPPRPTLLAI